MECNIKLTPEKKNLIKSLCATVFFIVLPVILFSAAGRPSPKVIDYHVEILEGNCIECGLCEAIAPDCFIVEDGEVHVLSSYQNCNMELCLEAEEACPLALIYVYW